MNIARRFAILVKGNVGAALDAAENPEHSLGQLIVEMAHQLEATKRATAQAMATEGRLRAQIEKREGQAADLDAAAERALQRQDEALARASLRQAERSRQEARQLAQRLVEQERETEQIRLATERMKSRLEDARGRLQLLRARSRQGDARRAINKVLRDSASCDLYGEFERLGEKVEMRVAEERCYLEINDDLSADSIVRRSQESALDAAVDDRLAALRAALETPSA